MLSRERLCQRKTSNAYLTIFISTLDTFTYYSVLVEILTMYLQRQKQTLGLHPLLKN